MASETGERRIEPRDFLKAGALIAIAWSVYQLYLVIFGFQVGHLQRPLHLVFALALTFATRRLKPSKWRWASGLDIGLIVLSFAIGLYVIFNIERTISRMEFIDDVYKFDFVFGIITILLVLEACRRLLGWSLVVVAALFLSYGFLGPWLPGGIAHRGIEFKDFVDLNFLTTQGLFGIPIGVSVRYVFYFVLFAAFLELSGGGDLFIDLAFRLTGTTRGGSAKSAVVASSLMGTVSGSAVANTVGTGVFTIPLMKKSGYPATFAGAVEATASTGGQIMPPIMGAAAFVMAEMIGVPYIKVMEIAIIPAVIFYISIFAIVDLKAQKEGILGLNKKDLPDIKGILRRIPLLLPLIVLVISIITGASIMMSAFRGIVAVFLVSLVVPKHRMGPYRILEALRRGAEKSPIIAVPAGVAGIIIGIVTYTGLGLKFSYFVLTLSGGHLLIALVFVMITCIILGMGMPTTAAYILSAVIMAAALETLGIPRLASHMFIFYFSILSMVTPPIALCAYAAAGISGSDIMSTGVKAFQLSLAGFLVPYVCVFNPALLMQGPLFEVLRVSIGCAFGVWALAGVVVGFFFGRLHFFVRFVLLLGALSLVTPQLATDIAGIVLIAVVISFQVLVRKKKGLRTVSEQVVEGK
jgi:TRAP transporter 4TM/12TM fusion protein